MMEETIAKTSSADIASSPNETVVHAETISEKTSSDANVISSNRPTEVSAEDSLEAEVSAKSSEKAQPEKIELSNNVNDTAEVKETGAVENKPAVEPNIPASDKELDSETLPRSEVNSEDNVSLPEKIESGAASASEKISDQPTEKSETELEHTKTAIKQSASLSSETEKGHQHTE
ncbi:MAG: hypothetical protein Q4D17_08825, partial [Planctomycetia bacterium]|nr:hypothetical protein [Planctomycetia bacterium]